MPTTKRACPASLLLAKRDHSSSYPWERPIRGPSCEREPKSRPYAVGVSSRQDDKHFEEIYAIAARKERKRCAAPRVSAGRYLRLRGLLIQQAGRTAAFNHWRMLFADMPFSGKDENGNTFVNCALVLSAENLGLFQVSGNVFTQFSMPDRDVESP
jgi:hypothetical protein